MSNDEIERVARAIYEAERGGEHSRWAKTDAFSKGIYLDLARAALAAMRPAVDPVKLAEIRERHEADNADQAKWPFSVQLQMNADRDFLLSELEGVKND